MEKKGTLLIVAAVGVFLLAVLGAALILYSPMNSAADTNMAIDSNSNAWVLPNDQAQSAPNQNTVLSTNKDITLPLTEIAPEKSSDQLANTQDVDQPATQQVKNNTNTGTAPSVITTNSQPIQDLTVYSTNTTVIAKDGTTTLDLTTPKTVTTTTNNSTATTNQSSTTTNQSSTNKTESTGISKTPKDQTVVKASNSVAPSSTSINTQKKVSVAKSEVSKPEASYWVQAASYTSKAHANEARDNLQAEEIPSEVFTYQKSNGITYYRLRVGPYLTESEANYWNKRIQLVDEFAHSESYVTNTALPVTN